MSTLVGPVMTMPSETKLPMIGSFRPYGPAGRNCPCCGEPAGKGRTIHRRARKRSERQLTKIQMKKEAHDGR